MATIKAFLRTSKNDKNKPANVRFRLSDGRTGIDKDTGKEYDGIQVFHKSELTVLPDRWDAKQQKIKARCIIDEQEKVTFDTSINERKAIIKNIYLKKGKTLTSDLLDAEIEKLLRPEKQETNAEIRTLFQFLDKFLKDTPERKDKTTGRPLTKNSAKQYPTTITYLREFAKKMHKRDFEFDEVDQRFYDKFIDFLQGKSFTQNSVGKHIKVLKTMLNEASRQGYNRTNHYNTFRVFMEDVDNIYLNETELHQLKDADLSGAPYLDRVRDWFLLL